MCLKTHPKFTVLLLSVIIATSPFGVEISDNSLGIGQQSVFAKSGNNETGAVMGTEEATVTVGRMEEVTAVGMAMVVARAKPAETRAHRGRKTRMQPPRAARPPCRSVMMME